MSIKSKAKLGVILTVDESAPITLFEGDVVKNLVYKSGTTEKTISGAVRVIDASTKGNNSVPTDCPPEPYSFKYITPYALVIDSSSEFDADLTRINISNILRIGEVNGEIVNQDVTEPTTTAITAAVEAVKDGGMVTLPAGKYIGEKLTFGKSVVISGPLSGTQTPNSNTSKEAVVAAPIEVASADAEVTFRGLSFSETAHPVIRAAKAVKFVNCRFEGIVPDAVKTMMVNMDPSVTAKVEITGCYFGTPAEVEGKKIYNMFEMSGKLEDGSEFSNNYFDVDCCSHNKINIYDVVDGANIKVNGNTFPKTDAMIRIGIKGAVRCNVLMENNAYDYACADITDPEQTKWAGMVCIQPYGKQTTDMSGWVINLNKTKNSSGVAQLGILYFGGADMPYDATKCPKVYVDGKEAQLNLIIEQ